MLDLLEKSRLKVHTELDYKNQRSYGKMDLALAGSNLLGVEGFMDKTKIGFAMPVIYDKYVLMDLKDKDCLLYTSKRKTGARGLRSILEEIMLDIMYERCV